ncbi:unannotated protein [freshwater metagenome]|uniref:Unannotated protein n=1 Tax=freshwater metagenome TaxID=449393 RepID=A0A6J6Q0Y9_9ZZZZ
MYLERAHLPLRSAACAGEINLADARSKPIASSAAETIFEVGALTTITPAAVAAGISTLSKPTPARAITFKPFAAAIASASILVAERIKTASTPLPSAAKSSARSAPLQLRTSKSGPNASSVAGLNSSAIKTIGFAKDGLLATCCCTFFVIIFISRFNPRHHLAQVTTNLFDWM